MNDLQSADAFFKLIDEKKQKLNKYNFEYGHKFFIIRLSISVLREILYDEPSVIKSIKKIPKLNEILNQCSINVQERFISLYDCCKGEKNEKKFKDNIEKVRHKIGFHYDKKLILNAANELCKRNSICKIEIADHISKWRFHIGDLITDEIVCSLWEIRYSKNRVQEADKVVEWIMKILHDYLYFSGNYIERYLRYYNLFK